MKNKITQINLWAKKIDKKYADYSTTYGAIKKGDKWVVNFWHPLAKKIKIIIFDAISSNKKIDEVWGKFHSPNWSWEFKKNMNGKFYQYEITQEDGSINLAMDPYAKSMAAFNWEGRNDKVGKAAFIDFEYNKTLFKLRKINNPQPVIYEANIRDITSLRKDVKIPGSFLALKEINFAKHLKDLGITHIQFLPIHNCYALDENNKKILNKGDGSGWNTNYNWGYDPHNYFSINGWYSSNPKNPYIRMKEFKEIVSYFHNSKIKVIVDVVYNHTFTNRILNNILPNYYYRYESKIVPVLEPAIASSRAMVRRLIIDSIMHFVKTYDIDGLRFDLSTFTDKKTLLIVAKKIRKLKPNFVLHGEAWNLTDLKPRESFSKKYLDNSIDFGYFNDTIRNAIKGDDSRKRFSPGILGGKLKKQLPNYLASIIGGIQDFKQDVPKMSTNRYARFTKHPNISLQYFACHDGYTLWDKINLTTKGDKFTKFSLYRQAIMMQQLTMGRTLYLGGTEFLYTKPYDPSGYDTTHFQKSKNILDLFNLGDKYHSNTYKTTDFSAGFRWKNLNKEIKLYIYDFMANINKFRISTKFFNLSTQKEINNSLKFIKVSKTVIDFNVKVANKTIKVIHNFGDDIYEYKQKGKIIFESKINSMSKTGKIDSNSSVVIQLENYH